MFISDGCAVRLDWSVAVVLVVGSTLANGSCGGGVLVRGDDMLLALFFGVDRKPILVDFLPRSVP